jgi:serine/threonine protein kinase
VCFLSRFSYFVVFPGELLSDEGFFSVAIKMLKSSASREAEEDFMREVEVMSSFRNEHILTLIGIVLRGKNTYCKNSQTIHQIYILL